MRPWIMRFALLSLVSVSCNGCPFTMDSTNQELLLRNHSNRKIKILLNLSYPDSSLQHAMVDSYMNPWTTEYVGTFFSLKRKDGLTLFVFDYAYFDAKWHEHAGTPDKYLNEDHILKRFVVSRAELDSLGWRLVFP